MIVKLLVDRPAYSRQHSIIVKAGSSCFWEGVSERGDLLFRTKAGYAGSVSHDDCLPEA